MVNNTIIFFVLWALAVGIFSYLLSVCLIGIKQNTKLNTGIIGVIMLPMVTSLPEIITALLSPALTDAKYATFNMLGSNTLTQTALVLVFILFAKKKIYNKFSKVNINTTKLLVLLSAILIMPFFWNKLHIVTLGAPIQLWIFLIAYLLYIHKSLQTNEKEPEDKKVSLNKWQSISGFILFACLLTYAAVQLIMFADLLAQPDTFKNIEISQSIAGTLFLSVATTLPEILTFYWLIRLNYPSIAINGILGSDLFNIAILAIADIFVINGSAFGFVYSGGLNTIIARKFLFTLPAYGMMLWLVSKERKNNKILSIVVALATVGLFLWSFKVF